MKSDRGSGSWTRSLLTQLTNKEFRDAYVAEDIRTGIAFQIRALREARGLSQADLGTQAGKAQSAIARLENPDYGRFSLSTLLELASAFDVALLVRFVAFSELVAKNRDLSPSRLAAPAFAEDLAMQDEGGSASIASLIRHQPKSSEDEFSPTQSEGALNESGADSPPMTFNRIVRATKAA